MTYLLTQGTSNADLMEIYHDRLYFESAAMIPALITVGKHWNLYPKAGPPML